MPPSPGNVQFLYSILQQVDTTKLDWEAIAQANNIPTGNAARMRWRRYKKSMKPADENDKTPKKPGARKRDEKDGELDEEQSPTPAKRKKIGSSKTRVKEGNEAKKIRI